MSQQIGLHTRPTSTIGSAESEELRVRGVIAAHDGVCLDKEDERERFILALYGAHRRRLRTTNMVERLNKEVKRRTPVATLFPNEASCLRLVTAVLMEASQEWVTGKVYLSLTDD